MTHLAALLGIFVFIGLAWLLSERRDRFPLRTVIAGLGLQVLFGAIILRTQAGAWFFERIDHVFQRLLGYAGEGTAMVFGPLANSALMAEKWGADNGFLFAVTITGTIVLVSALSALLYHYGLLQRVVRGMAYVMRHVMGVSGSESLAAAANIFMGQTEAPLVIKPYLATMTRSELLALMTGGMATIAGGVLAAYIAMGISPGHLLTASVMSAPASLMMAKIMLPETDSPTQDSGTTQETPRETVNGLDALCQGASEGMKLALHVLAMLIAFVAIVAMANGGLSALLGLVGIDQPRPLQWLLGWLNAPFAWLMGVPWQDCASIGGILGERIVLNEFIGYVSLSQGAEHLQPQSMTIATYALCGFANFASIAIQIGGIGAMVENRRAEIAQLGLRAMIAGLLACYCTACIAGLLTRV
jgi:CNT family concentrative nucleoside transporter